MGKPVWTSVKIGSIDTKKASAVKNTLGPCICIVFDLFVVVLFLLFYVICILVLIYWSWITMYLEGHRIFHCASRWPARNWKLLLSRPENIHLIRDPLQCLICRCSACPFVRPAQLENVVVGDSKRHWRHYIVCPLLLMRMENILPERKSCRFEKCISLRTVKCCTGKLPYVSARIEPEWRILLLIRKKENCRS